MLIVLIYHGKTINLTSDNMSITSTNFNVNKNGKTTIIDTTVSSAESTKEANFTVKNNDDTLRTQIIPNRTMVSGLLSKAYLWCNSGWAYVGASSESGNAKCRMVSAGSDLVFIDCTDGIYTTTMRPNGITTPTVTQTSLATEKKNFEEFKNALEIIKGIDIYKYNLKNEEDKTKKHIGFVIGDDFNYSQDVTSINNDGVDVYSFVSLCCKAIQEQQEQIEQLKNEIKELKGEK